MLIIWAQNQNKEPGSNIQETISYSRDSQRHTGGPDSRIVERISRTEENKFDRITKEAQAKERIAKAEEALANAELIREQTDALANEFVKDVSGQKRREHELDKEYDAAVSMATKAASKVQSAKIDTNRGDA